MLRIAVCDDDAFQLKSTRHYLEHYISARGLTAKIFEFSSGHEMLNALMEEGNFNLYILDIVMPEMSGIDLGKELRKQDSTGSVIYLTSSPDFALESYDIRAFHYLLKPVAEDRLFSVLDDAVKTLCQLNETALQVKTRDGIIRILYDNIVYTELHGRTVHYLLIDGGIVESMTLNMPFREAMATLLDDPRFMLCGSSYVVNLYYVKMVEKNGVLLSDGRRLSLPRAACPGLRAAWSDYWLERGKRA